MTIGEMKMDQTVVNQVSKMANTMMVAANRSLYTTIFIANQQRKVVGGRHGWSGREPEDFSAGWYYGPAKAFELVETIDQDDSREVVLTPVEDFSYGGHFMGGMRRRVGDLYVVTTASAWKQEADALIAVLLNFAVTNLIRLHHVGFRHQTQDLAWRAANKEAQLRMTDLIHRRLGDRSRYYVPVIHPQRRSENYWLEYEWSSEGPESPGIHWDFRSSGHLLDFMQRYLPFHTEGWENQENSPIGMISTYDRDGTELAVMQRKQWSDPQSW